MSNFELNKFKVVKGKQDFYKLIKGGECFFDSFQEEIEEEQQYEAELRTIISFMQLVSDLHTVPRTKFNPITPEGDPVKEYEFKSKHLRVYVFHLEYEGKVIVIGGYKNTQESDIRRFRNLKREFLEGN